MLTTKRKPATVGEILAEEFMRPLGLTQGALAAAMGVPRKHVNQLCNDRRTVTAPTALILARVFGNSPDFWLNGSGAPTCGRRCIRPASWRASSVQSPCRARREAVTAGAIPVQELGTCPRNSQQQDQKTETIAVLNVAEQPIAGLPPSIFLFIHSAHNVCRYLFY
jgi:addiction module HigA family antidote